MKILLGRVSCHFYKVILAAIYHAKHACEVIQQRSFDHFGAMLALWACSTFFCMDVIP